MYNNSFMRRAGEDARGTYSATSAIEDRLAALRANNPEMASRSPLSVSVQRHEAVSDGVSRVLFQTGGPVTAANLELSIAQTFENRVRYLEHSAHRPNPSNRTLVAAFVALNAPAVPYTDAAVAEMAKVTGENVFADQNDDIWRVFGDGDARMLVQDSDDDLASLLATRNSVSLATESMMTSLGEPFTAGDAILYYDPAREELCTGIAVSKREVFNFAEQSAFAVVNPAQVLIVDEKPLAGVVTAADITLAPAPGTGDVIPNTGTPVNVLNGQGVPREPLSRDNMIQRHLAYMSKLYSTNGEYFQRLKALIDGAFKDGMAIN